MQTCDRLSDAWGKVYFNGKLEEADDALTSVFDRGMLYGDGVFETVRVYAGRPFMLDEHVQRMAEGCAVIGLEPPAPAEVESGVRAVLEANSLSDAYLRITVTRGATGRLWFDLTCSKPFLLVFAKPLTPPDFGKGVRLVISTFRSDERSPLSGVKQIGILPKILARNEAVKSGADDGLLLDTRGFVSESTSSNIFWAREGELYTPSLDCGILPGVTRKTVVEIARKYGIKVHEGCFAPQSVREAEEAFLTSSTWEVAPVYSLDGKTFPGGSPGGLTVRLSRLYSGTVNAG